MDWKKFGKKLLFPPLWIVILLVIFSTAALVTVFVKGWDALPVGYVVYVVAFYTLTIFCLACWKTFPKYYRKIKGAVYANPYTNRYFTDAVFKTHVTLYRSLIINLVYVAVNAASAVIYRTRWFAIFAIYYAIMAIMRFLLVRYVNRNGIGENRMGELKRARFCAYILMTVNLTLSGAVVMMVHFDRGFEYQGVLIYVVALYTFYITAAAVKDMIVYRKYNSPVMSMTKIIKLASSLFSMLFLETAMLAQFGEESTQGFQKIMIMATGACIGAIVVAISLYMIVQTTKEIAKKERCRYGTGKE